MKRQSLILLAFFICMSVYSQTEKGKMFIGGQISLSTTSNPGLDTLSTVDRTAFSIKISPNFAYFIKDNFAIGGNFSLGYSNSTNEYAYINQVAYLQTDKSNSTSIGIGGFARYYAKITDKFFFFMHGGATYTYQKDKSDQTYINLSHTLENKQTHSNTIAVALSPGLVYFVTPKLGIQATFGELAYSFTSQKNDKVNYDNHQNSSNFGFNLRSSSLTFGLNYYF